MSPPVDVVLAYADWCFADAARHCVSGLTFRLPCCHHASKGALTDSEFGRTHHDLIAFAGFDRDSIFLAFLVRAPALAAAPLRNRDDWALCLPCPEVFCAFDLGDSYSRHRVRHVCPCVIDCCFDRCRADFPFDSGNDCYGYPVVTARVSWSSDFPLWVSRKTARPVRRIKLRRTLFPQTGRGRAGHC